MPVAYKIPDEDALERAVTDVFIKTPVVRSQNELVSLINNELKKIDPLYRVGYERARKFVLIKGMATVDIEYCDARFKHLPNMCPVCKSELKTVSNSTLDGDVVEIGRKCGFCSYSTGINSSVPGRYTFFRKTSGLRYRDQRIVQLEKAQAFLKMASSSVLSADDGSFSEKLKELVNEINKLSDSDEIPYSIRNLIRLAETDDAGLVWLDPLKSVKKQFG